MKYLGIDFGTKKIGIAVSNTEGTIAFPKHILPHTKDVISTLREYIKQEGIEAIVIGHSRDAWGDDNTVQTEIHRFTDLLTKEFNLPIFSQDERGSTIAAKAHLYGKGNIANERWTGKENQKKREAADAGAAAIILQRYLDTQKLAS